LYEARAARASQFVSRISGLRFTHFFACCYNELALIVTAVKRARSDHAMAYLRVRLLDERCSDDERTIFK
jgi:hypothetical protein